jgi:uncharacterized membrane protein (UPF0127 family)
MSGVRFVVLRSPAEQELGLQHRARVEADTLYVFPGVRGGAVFHSRNVPEPFDLAFLSEDWRVLWKGTLVPEADTAAAPFGTALAIESRAGMMDAVGLRAGAAVPPGPGGV